MATKPMTMRGQTVFCAAAAALALGGLPATSRAQSLEEQTRRPPGTSSLNDDSERLRGPGSDAAHTDSLDDDSQDERGRTDDQDGTNSLDDGSMQGGNAPDPD